MSRTIEQINADIAKLEDEKKAMMAEARKSALKECKRLIREYGLRRSELEKSFTSKIYKNTKVHDFNKDKDEDLEEFFNKGDA